MYPSHGLYLLSVVWRKAAASKQRFVLWTHLFEPHSSYMPHKEFPSSGTTGVPGLMEKYDHEIAFVDMWVGKLLAAVKSQGLADNTAVVVMADLMRALPMTAPVDWILTPPSDARAPDPCALLPVVETSPPDVMVTPPFFE